MLSCKIGNYLIKHQSERYIITDFNKIKKKRVLELFHFTEKVLLTEVYSERRQTSKIDHFAKKVNGFQTLTLKLLGVESGGWGSI